MMTGSNHRPRRGEILFCLVALGLAALGLVARVPAARAAVPPATTLRIDVRVGFLTIDETNTTFRPGVFLVLPLR